MHLLVLSCFYWNKWLKISLNLSYFGKLNPHIIIIIKNVLSEVWIWIYWTCDWIFESDINVHNVQNSSIIETALLFSANCTNHLATDVTVIHSTNWRKEKYVRRRCNDVITPRKPKEQYIDRWFNFVATSKKIMNEM